MKTLYNLELMRHGVTPAQFLAYCRSQCKKYGISWDMDSRYFADGEKHSFGYLDSHYDGGTPSTRPAVAETCKSLPYEHQTYIRNFDGSVYNEIVEFSFDDERTGTGYFYIISTESDSAEDAEKEVQTIARYHARQIERNTRQIEKNRASIAETENNAAHGWTDQQWAAGHVEMLHREIESLEHENAEHAAAIAEMTGDQDSAATAETSTPMTADERAEMTAAINAAGIKVHSCNASTTPPTDDSRVYWLPDAELRDMHNYATKTADNGAEMKGESTMKTATATAALLTVSAIERPSLTSNADCLCDYDRGYICDIISEIADGRTSIYYSDIKEYIAGHIDEVTDAISEFGWDGCGGDLYKAGQMAEYREIENGIYSELEEGLTIRALDYIEHDMKVSQITPNQWEQVQQLCADTDNCDRMDSFLDSVAEIVTGEDTDEE